MSRRLLFLLLVVLLHLIENSEQTSSKKYVYIKNVKTGLFLEGTKNIEQVTLRSLSSSSLQLWKLSATYDGKFFIINKNTGYVLDIQGGASKLEHVITYSKHGGKHQLWYIHSNGTIVSAARKDLALDIKNKKLIVDTIGKDNQLFKIIHQCNFSYFDNGC